MNADSWIVPALAACGLSTVFTLALMRILTRRAILDHPNERSLHQAPTPRGGGWAIMAAFACGIALLGPDMRQVMRALPLTGGAALLMLISWLDDLRTLPPLPRFAVQIAAVGAGLTTLHGGVFQGWLPPALDYALTGLGWLWFVNLFNFMDGMDGLAGGEALTIAYGLFLLPPHDPAAMVLAAAVLGFLVWNWGPSRIILGDVGSIPLGYLLGALLFRAAEQGQWIAALLLPLYFLVDATVTLARRALRGEKIWRPHREHFYQRAVLGGHSHRRVAIAVMEADAALVICAVVLAPRDAFLAASIGAGSVLLLLVWMARAKR